MSHELGLLPMARPVLGRSRNPARRMENQFDACDRGDRITMHHVLAHSSPRASHVHAKVILCIAPWIVACSCGHLPVLP